MMGICKEAKTWLRRIKIIKKLYFEVSQNYGIVNRFEDEKAA